MSAEASASTDDRPVAIVTGGSRGIGKAIVERLARAGFDVRFTWVSNEAAAGAVVDQLRGEGFVAGASRVDARDVAACSAMVDETIAARGRIDVLVNNAAVISDGLLATMSASAWSKVLDTSLNGLFGTTQPAIKQMMRQRRGRVVNLTSVSGLVGIVGQTNYSAAKAAIIGFTRSLAKEVAPLGIAVNAVAPGFIETDMIAHFAEQQRAKAMGQVPMRRFGSAEEVAGLVGYLALEAPLYLTGQVVAIDGGLST